MPEGITVIQPGDPRHRQVIRAALKAKDVDTLTALRGNTHKPIHLVKATFYYFLMLSSWWDGESELDYVAVFLPESRRSLLKLADPNKQYTQAELTPSIPLDTYDFAL